jgi:uncharacterized cupin superfamily protein
MELLSWDNTLMEPHRFRVAPSAGSAESYAQEGEEFLYMLEGCIELDGGEREQLKKGDSYHFKSSTPPHWWNPGKAEAWALRVNTPPTF